MKTKTNHSIFFKAMVLVLAFALAILCAPMDALVALAQMSEYTDYSYMTIGKFEDEVKTTVAKGKTYTISEAYIGGNKDYVVGREIDSPIVGENETATVTSSSVAVKYGSQDVAVTELAANDEGQYGTFVADKVGTYTITYSYDYTVEVNGEQKSFTNSYELKINSEIAVSTISFEQNQENFIPSIIDLNQLTPVLDGEQNVVEYNDANNEGVKNLVIPQVKVTNDKNEVVDAAEVNYVTSDAQVGAEGYYVVVTARGGVDPKDVTVTKDGDQLYIKSSVFADVNYGAGKYTIRYALYEDGEFVTATTKSTEVKADKYYKDGKYELKLELASAWSDNGQTGVETTLPAAKGVTSKETNPASEAVDVYYTVKVFHSATGTANSWEAIKAEDYNIEGQDDVLDANGNLINPTSFKPLKDGYYTFEYAITDFYGNTVKSQKGVYTYKNITDEQAPNPVIYDAGLYAEPETKDNEKVDETHKLQTRSVPNGVVIYAIGIDDNVSKAGDENVVLTRQILTDESVTKFTVDEVSEFDLDAFNLVFNYRDDTSSMAYENLKANNAVIRKATADVDSDVKMLDWLNKHDYKIVVDNANYEVIYDIFTSYFADNNITSVTDKETALAWFKTEAALEAGFAYLNVDKTFGASSSDNGMGTGSYRIRYTAQDAAGTSKEVTKSMYIGTYDDTDAPDIKFATTLSDTYLPDSTVSFDVPTASDNYDTNMVVKTMYRYLAADGETVEIKKDNEVVSNNALTELQADLAGVKDKKDPSVLLTNKYAAYFTENAAGYVDLTDSKASKYSIDLAEAGETAVKLQIVTYVYDDCGNANMYAEEINISNATDNAAPAFKAMDIEGEGNFVRNYMQGEEIELPKFTVLDDAVSYLSYEVSVYYVNGDTKTKISTYDAYAERNILNSNGGGSYTIHAGKFVAAFAGEYQVSISAKDSKNKTVVSFINYTVGKRNIVQPPVINTSLENSTVELDESPVISIPTPSVSYDIPDSVTYDKKEGSTATYIVRGVDENGKATNYSTTHGQASSFTPNKVGEYNIEYNVKLQVYNKNVFKYVEMSYDASTGEYDEGGYFATLDDKYKVSVVSENEYALYSVDKQIEYYLVKNENGIVTVYDDLTESRTDITETFEGEEIITLDEVAEFFTELKEYNLTSDTYTIVVQDTKGPSIAEFNYETAITAEDFATNGITIKGIQATDKGSDINADKSKIVLSWKLANGESGSQTYSEDVFSDHIYKKTSTTGKTYDGTYTITYTVYDNNNNYSTKSYVISVGDDVAPTIVVEDNFVSDKYTVGTELKIDLSKITVGDNKDLPEGTKPVVILKNTATGEEIEAKENGNIYAYDLDEIGTYKLTIEVEDAVGHVTSEDYDFEVSAKTTDSTQTYQVVGTVLIVISVLILAGVVVYFVVSKVKLDKELKK